MKLQGLLALGLLIAVTSQPTFADDAKEEAVKKERKQFEGTWQVVSLEVDGNMVADENARKITVINESDGKWTIEVDGKVLARGTPTPHQTAPSQLVPRLPKHFNVRGISLPHSLCGDVYHSQDTRVLSNT